MLERGNPPGQPWGWEAPGKEILKVGGTESGISEALLNINLLETHLLAEPGSGTSQGFSGPWGPAAFWGFLGDVSK